MTSDLYPQGYPKDWDPVLINRFLMQGASDWANKIAIVSHDNSYTYAELAAAAEGYGKVLREAGLQHGDPVAVMMEPGFESVSLLLACGEAGYVYIPFNADLPRPRVAEICRRVSPRLIVVGPGASLPPEEIGDLAAGSAQASGNTLTILERPPEFERTDRRVLESDLAYVFFTSGSTGVPKGVMMSHRAAVVALRAIAHGCSAHPRLASVSPLGFDLSLLDTAAALRTGGTIYFIPRNIVLHPFRLLEFLRDHQIEQLHSVPTVLSILARHCDSRLGELTSLRRIILTGEEITVPLVATLNKRLPGVEISTIYGQTESICCTFEHLPNPLPGDCDSIPLGIAYPGAELLLLDDDGKRITEQGIIGELYLRAASLFEGYWKNPDATARALVSDPERPYSDERLLRTGDLAVLGPYGFSYIGRRDHQVQVNGNRVELTEIERCIAKLPGVQAVVVTAQKNDSGHQVLATIAASAELQGKAVEIRNHCRAHLPSYMVPSHIQFVDDLPRLPSGKIDRKALANLRPGTETDQVRP